MGRGFGPVTTTVEAFEPSMIGASEPPAEANELDDAKGDVGFNGLTLSLPAPSQRDVFKAVWDKNWLLGKRRGRLCSGIVPVVINGGFAVGTYYLFHHLFVGQSRDDADEEEKAHYDWILNLMIAMFVPMQLTFLITGVYQTAYQDLVGEKEDKMKIIQNVYGLTNTVYWASWFMYYGIVGVIAVVLIYILLMVVTPCLRGIHIILSFIVIVLAFVQQCELVGLCSIFFDKVKTCTAVTGFMNFIFICAGTGLQALQGQAGPIYWIVGLVPIVNVYQALASLFFLRGHRVCEDDGSSCEVIGANFNNLFNDRSCLYIRTIDVKYLPWDCDPLQPKCCAPQGYVVDSNTTLNLRSMMEPTFFPPGNAIVLLLLNVFLMAFLVWWLDNVWQGHYGQAKPLLFCFDPKYMRKAKATPQASKTHADTSRHVALSLKGLRKVFQNKVAVDDITMDAHGGEIFALLGHNGAGKTTAINCVVGLIPMTAGEASVNGFDVRYSIDEARRNLGICPQDNPMYPEFTVRQHISFFSRLRGYTNESVNMRIPGILEDLGIHEKVDDLCKNLSGGQKRRLWAATALLADTPVMFFDEPTSGMDPSSRRELWHRFLHVKALGRCLIFTSHYLEEVDVLADRKAVLARGKVQAIGTSRELKHQFGLGYHLILELAVSAQSDVDDEVLRLVKQYATDARQEEVDTKENGSDTVRTVKILLPYASVPNFGPLLGELEMKKGEMMVSDYTIAMTSLEEVFMRLGKQAELEADGGNNVDFTDVTKDTAVDKLRAECSDMRSLRAQFRLTAKMFQSRKAVFVFCVMPAIFMIIAFLLLPVPDEGSNAINGYAICMYPSLAFAFTSSSFIVDLVKAKEQKVKIVGICHGLKPHLYWLGNMMAHYLSIVPTVIVFVILYIAKRPDPLKEGALVLPLIVVWIFPVCILLFTYSCSMLFQGREAAAKFQPIFFFASGLIPPMLMWALCRQESTRGFALILHFIFSALLPTYGLGGTMVWLITKYAFMEASEFSIGDSFTSEAAVPLYFMPVQIMWLLGLLTWTQVRGYKTQPRALPNFDSSLKDSDVLAEEARVQAGGTGIDAVLYQGLFHTYKVNAKPSMLGPLSPAKEWKETHAVRGISLGIHKGQCFGLLGPNGAGKTTTLSVLTGEVRPPTAGKVLIGGFDIGTTTGLLSARALLGVCPQVDPLVDTLSGRDHLIYHGRLKGVPERELGQTVDSLLQRLGLEVKDGKKPAGTYSGGMKRKLSLGIALIGHSPVLFLDEPSAAVDAGAKRHLWKVVRCRGPDQTVVLTTHSMEEAEALCERIAVQVRGQLRCLGTPMHIKSRYSEGYQLELVTNGEDIASFVHSKVTANAKLIEHFDRSYLFQLPPLGEEGAVGLDVVFRVVESSKESIGILDFSVTQPSLEQVFLRFAREQHEMDLKEARDTE